MKKTWTTKALIALMTLAMVVGVFIVAPKEARADVAVTKTGTGATTQTVTVGSSIAEFGFTAANGGYTHATYAWELVNVGPDGALPSGVVASWSSTSPDLTISGTPAVAGTFTSTVKVTVSNVDVPGENQVGYYATPLSITVNPQSSLLTISTPSAPANPTVGVDTSIVFNLTGYPMPDNVTVTGTGNGLTYSYDKNAKTVTVSGKPTVAEARSISVSGSNGVNGTVTGGPVAFNVAKGTAPAITITGDKSVPKGSNTTLQVSGAPENGTYKWYKGTSPSGTQVGTGPSYLVEVPSNTVESGASYYVVWSGTNYADGTSGSHDITYAKQKAPISITPPISGSYAAGSRIYLRADIPTGVTGTWSQTNGSGSLVDPNNATGAYYVVAAGDLGKTITFTMTTAENGTYSANQASATATIYSNDYVTSPTTSSITFNTATLYDVKDFNATTFAGGSMRISNSNPAIATVTVGSPSGQEVGSSSVLIANNTKVYVKAKAYGRTYIDVVPENGTGSSGQRVTVFVGSATPTLEVQFWSSDYCTTTLSKVYNWGTLKITVDNYNPAYPYVTVTRSNIRTYVQGGSYYSHPSTYTYTAALTQDLNDPLKATATLYVIPQYNGSTYYSAAYTGAVTKNSPTIYVTGYTTLPQTGPDYTWAYVLGGLCLITVATAVTLNVRKKKRENV